MKQTAVEWLMNEIYRMYRQVSIVDLIEQAKEMEKQQIIEAHGSKLRKSRGVTNYEYWYTGEDYYNETYKK